jgi:hypothetical protein
MSTPTLEDRAATIGASVPALRSWKRCGVDIFDDDQVKAKVAKMRNLPPDLKPEFLPRVAAVIATDPDDPTSIDIEAIISELKSTTDKHQAQTVKLKIDGLINAYKLREAAGRYVSRSKVEENLIRIGAAVKGAVLRMEVDLPPMLEGMTPPQMQNLIRQKTDEVLATLSDAASQIWQDEN